MLLTGNHFSNPEAAAHLLYTKKTSIFHSTSMHYIPIINPCMKCIENHFAPKLDPFNQHLPVFSPFFPWIFWVSFGARLPRKAQTGLRTFALVALSRAAWDVLRRRWQGTPGAPQESCPRKLQVPRCHLRVPEENCCDPLQGGMVVDCLEGSLDVFRHTGCLQFCAYMSLSLYFSLYIND